MAAPTLTQHGPDGAPRDKAGYAAAHKRLNLALALALIGLVVGGTLDRAWHSTHVFDTFYSPPHLFIYGVTGLSILTVATIAFSPRMRPCFGEGFRVPLLKFPVPAPLVLLGGGFAVLVMAGLLDDAWHSTFGLDETAWSTPHSMLGWGIFLTFLGFTSSRLALARVRPLNGLGLLFYGFIVLSSCIGVVMGPFGQNNTPNTVFAISQIPILAAQPAAQHTYSIYLTWNIDRTNPVFPALAALAAGVGLTAVRAVTPRHDYLVLVALLSSLTTMIGDRNVANLVYASGGPANWLPIPLLPAVLLFVYLSNRHVPDDKAWAAAGVVFGLLCLLIWGTGPLSGVFALLAGPAMLGGSRIGKWVATLLVAPTREALSWAVPVMGVGFPVLTGIVDLYLRLNTA